MKLFAALLTISSAAAFAPASRSTFGVIPAATETTSQLYGEYGASSTSFYTTTEKQDSYESLEAVLEHKCADKKVRLVIKDMLDACADITEALRVALVTVEGSENTFGDAQLSVDVIADNLMWDACKDSPTIREGASEEDPEVRNTDEQGDGEYTVCWDPLDGSSIVDNNWAVGTMVGIWPKSTGLIGATGRDQVTSLVAIYGPRTTVLVALDDGTYEFSYGCTPEGCQLPDGSFEPWICSRHKIQIAPDCKIFSPANLRLAFEAAPFALLVEKAGGKSSEGVTGGSILDVQINAVDQRTALCIGSANEVDRFNDWVIPK